MAINTLRRSQLLSSLLTGSAKFRTGDSRKERGIKLSCEWDNVQLWIIESQGDYDRSKHELRTQTESDLLELASG